MNPLRVLVLHSDVPPDAPPDELDTLAQADAIVGALESKGHRAATASFVADQSRLHGLVASHRADAIFNLVESVEGSGARSARVPYLFERLGVAYTGATGRELELAGNKPQTKRLIREARLPTPDWSEPPDWQGFAEAVRYIVKSALEDASHGLDDGSVVTGLERVRERAEFCEQKFGGRWFAEAYVDGREFNVAVLDDGGTPLVLPLAEMTFQEWQAGRPKIVGYNAKWEEESFESTRTIRAFGVEEEEPALASELRDLAVRTWSLLGLSGYARIDFRVDVETRPTILEVNPNPCLEPGAGFAAAAARSGIDYPALIERILAAAHR
jgi:D-alanine-D-alanine ligase